MRQWGHLSTRDDPPMNTTATITRCPMLNAALERFMNALAARNRSAATITAYQSDLGQFVAWLQANNGTISTIDQVERLDITEYLAELGRKKISGVTRARKLAAIRELFRYFVEQERVLGESPALGIETPKKERNVRAWLQPDEYRGMLSEAGSNARDFAILQVFLQTGIRVQELVDLRVDDVDPVARVLTVRQGKGQRARVIDLEKKGLAAIKRWLKERDDNFADVDSDYLFLNQYGQPISTRGVQKLVAKYRLAAGITKKAGCHSLRHTFASMKAKDPRVSPFQLREWLGHARLDTTMIYVHLNRQDGKKVMEKTSL